MFSFIYVYLYAFNKKLNIVSLFNISIVGNFIIITENFCFMCEKYFKFFLINTTIFKST